MASPRSIDEPITHTICEAMILKKRKADRQEPGPPECAPPPSVIHLGSRHHECWQFQRRMSAMDDRMATPSEAMESGLRDRLVMAWHPDLWRCIPAGAKQGSRALCFFHHHLAECFDDPQIVGGICINREMYRALKRRQPEKPVWLVPAGGSRDALPHAIRTEPSRKIRLMVVGRASAPVVAGHEMPLGSTRKGGELVLEIAGRLDPDRYAWVFIGPDWEGHAGVLSRHGWTVIAPGALPEPFHYAFYGEGDIHLILSQREAGPVALLETMGLGIWPVSTSAGLAPDVILDGENGSLVGCYDGANRPEIADCIAGQIAMLDRDRLEGARELIAASVAHHTWESFDRSVRDALRTIFPETAPPEQPPSPRRIGLRGVRFRRDGR